MSQQFIVRNFRKFQFDPKLEHVIGYPPRDHKVCQTWSIVYFGRHIYQISRVFHEVSSRLILHATPSNTVRPRRDSMIFKISWAADSSRSGTVWFRSGMIPSCHINCQKFGEFMFGKITTKKLILTSNFSSVLFRHTRSRQTFDT